MSKWTNALLLKSGDIAFVKPFRKEFELFETNARLALCTMRRPGYIALLYENGEVFSCKPEDLQIRLYEDKDLANVNPTVLKAFNGLKEVFSNGSK